MIMHWPCFPHSTAPRSPGTVVQLFCGSAFVPVQCWYRFPLGMNHPPTQPLARQVTAFPQGTLSEVQIIPLHLGIDCPRSDREQRAEVSGTRPLNIATTMCHRKLVRFTGSSPRDCKRKKQALHNQMISAPPCQTSNAQERNVDRTFSMAVGAREKIHLFAMCNGREQVNSWVDVRIRLECYCAGRALSSLQWAVPPQSHGEFLRVFIRRAVYRLPSQLCGRGVHRFELELFVLRRMEPH